MKKQWHEWQMRSVLRRYADGELLPAQTQIFERHLAGCESCRQRARAWKTAEQVLRQQVSHENMPDLRDASQMFRSAWEQAAAQMRNRQQTVRRRSAGALAGACALLGLWIVHPHTALRSIKTNTSVGIAIALSPQTTLAFRVPSRVQGYSSIKKQAAKKMVMSTGERMGRRIPTKRLRGNRLAIHHGTASGRKVVEVDGAIGIVEDDINEAQFASSENLSLMAQNMRGLPPDSHLIVAVTDDTAGNATENAAGAKTIEDSDAPTSSMATVSALQVDDTGTQVWRVCSVAQNNAGVMMVHCAAAWQCGRQPISSLAVTTETVTQETAPADNINIDKNEADRNEGDGK